MARRGRKPGFGSKAKAIAEVLTADPKRTYQNIADAFGLTRQRVHQIAIRAGLDGRPRDNKKGHTTPKTRARMKLAVVLTNAKISPALIAEQLQCSVPQVYYYLRKAGASPHDNSAPATHGSLVRRYYADGMGPSEIMRRTGLTFGQVWGIVQKYRTETGLTDSSRYRKGHPRRVY